MFVHSLIKGLFIYELLICLFYRPLIMTCVYTLYGLYYTSRAGLAFYFMVPFHTLFYPFNIVTIVFGIYLKIGCRRWRWLGLKMKAGNKDNNKNKTKPISLGPSVFTSKAGYMTCPRRRRSRRTHVFCFSKKKKKQ